MAFDVNGARAAGYTDDEIAAHLAAKTPNFNVAQASAAGYSPQEIIQHLTGPQAAQQPAAKVGSENGPDDPGFWGTVMVKGGDAVNRIAGGVAQGWLNMTGATPSTKAALKAQMDEEARLQAPLTAVHPAASAIGESLPSMAVPVGGAASVLGRAGKAALQGAVVPALQYADSAEDKLKNIAAGAAGSAAGATVLPAIGRVVAAGAGQARDAVMGTISPQVLALYARAQQLGIPVSAAQLSDSSFLKTLASTLKSIPGSGATGAQSAQQSAFNQAVSRTIGEDSPVVDQNLYAAAKARIGGQFQALSARNNLNVTPAVMSDVNGVIDNADRFATPDNARIIRNLAGDLRDQMDPATMTVPGPAYQAADSRMSGLMKSGDSTAQLVGQLRDALRTGMDHSISPADQAAWMEARGQYRNLKAIRDIVGKAGVDGDISPGLLMGRMNATGASKEAMAMGNRGDLGDIAQIGKQFVRDPVPNSGTTQRALTTAALTGGGAGIVGLPAAVAAAGGTIATARVANSLLNTGASGARAAAAQTARGTAAQPATLAQLLTQNPTKATADAGAATGRTIADLLRNSQ